MDVKKLKTAVGAALAALLVLPGMAEKAELFENPVIATDWPDPAIWRADGKFYSVATSLRTIRSSADGISWTDTGIDPLSPSARQKLYSISKNLWAPCVVRLNGRWVLYISVFISTPDDRIVALTSDSPTGPFEFAAEVVNGPKLGIMNAIDPYVVRTEGRTWMFFGSCQDGIHRVELSADGLSMLPGASPVHVAGRRSPYGPDGKWIQIWGQPGTWEGSFLFQRQGWWYLFFSGGIYRDHTYHLMVGRSRSIDGVFVNREGEELTRGKASPILFSDQGDKFYGPGHNGEIIVAEDGRNFMFYHSHDTAFKPAERPTFLQELIWDADGWPTFDGGKPKRFERRFKAAGLSNDRTDSATGRSASAEDIDCIAIYYPHWHKYPKGTEWFGKDWDQGEWHLARTAKRRFPGHKAPITPLYGYIDGKDPKDVEKEIALAANAGITVFMYDFYWYGGEMTMQESLEQGFLKARNRDRLKFCLMWCYHDRVDSFRDNPREPKRMLMPLARTEEEFLGLIRYATEHYFREPNHWTRDGKPFFSIYNARAFVKDRGGVEGTRAVLDKARDIAKAAGLKGIFFEAMNPENAKGAREMADAGFDILGNYALAPNYQPELRKEARAGRPLYDYETYTLPFHRRRWAELRDASRLAYIPAVTAGRDASMRCANEEPFPWKTLRYPYDGIATNNNPNAFERLVREAKAAALADPKKPGAISIYGWNEYTEGGYIAPNNYDADGALRAVAAVFGRRPADEYTYVNPSSRQLYTIPAADYENVAYGPHSKQKVDVFLPKGMKGPFPVVQYIHGGGWSSGAMEDHILGSSIRMLLANGIAVVGTGYRYIGDCVLEGVKPPVRGCLDDCEAAVRFVQAKAAEWNLDMSRFALAGGSAGACTCLYLGLKDNNALGIKALAPIIPQTSVDPKEMREWIPNSTYGAHAFGYRNFDDWLAHRADCLADIQRISPAELLRRIDATKAPHVVFQAGRLPKPGQLVEPTHSPVFCAKFKEIADAKGVACEFIQGGRLPCYGEAFVRIAEILTGCKKANHRGSAAELPDENEVPFTWGGRPVHPAVVNPVTGSDPAWVISLRGEWQFSKPLKDLPNRNGIWGNFNARQEWAQARPMSVPSCWEAQGVGEPGPSVSWDPQWDECSKPIRHKYMGEGWYRRNVTIPAAWKNRRIWLKVGGVKSVGWIWVNDVQVALVDNYCGTEKYEITDLVKPGESAKIVVDVDNRKPSRKGLMSSLHRWGGIYRDIELEATPQVFVDDAWVRGDFDGRLAEVHVEVGGQRTEVGDLRLRVTVEGEVVEQPIKQANNLARASKRGTGVSSCGTGVSPVQLRCNCQPFERARCPFHDVHLPIKQSGNQSIRAILKVALRDFRPWSPEHPNLYTAKVELVENGQVVQTRLERFGVRKLEVCGKEFRLNGKPFYMRGFGDDFVYPLTGLSPADRDVHRAHLRRAREAGFNAVRLHTHCEVPEYFEAADELGLLVQVELPYYSDVPCEGFAFDPKRDVTELWRNFRRHPSFAVYSMGNEGSYGKVLDERMHRYVKAMDPDRLKINQDSNRLEMNLPECADYVGGPIKEWPRGTYDPDRPFVTHEYLNLCVKSDSRDEAKYVGAWLPPATRKSRGEWLAKFGLGHDWGDRLQDAQHALQGVWQKRGIEAARLDPFCDGYSFWTLVDVVVWNARANAYSAQGLFNPFWETKRGGRSPESFAAFNSPSCVLVDFCPTQSVFVAGESFRADVFLAHYGDDPLVDARAAWSLSVGGDSLASGVVSVGDQPLGAVRKVASVPVTVPSVPRPSKAVFAVDVGGVRNSWDVWLFPKGPTLAEIRAKATRAGVVIAAAGTPEAKAALAAGRPLVTVDGVGGASNVSLGWWWMGAQVGTAIRPHRALGDFPHEGVLTPLWFRLLKKGAELPVPGVRPDDMIVVGEGGDKCYLYLCERTVGKSRVMECHGLDLLSDLPEGNCLLAALVEELARFD